MVERLRVTEEESMRVAESDLREVVRTIFLKCGVPEEDAERATDVLVTSDLRGVESHGVSNSLRGYVQGFKEDEINPAPNWKMLRESPSTANIDSDRGLGIVVGPRAMEIAIEKAGNVGVGVVTIRNSRHLGMISYHAMMALEARHDRHDHVVVSRQRQSHVRGGSPVRHEPHCAGSAPATEKRRSCSTPR